MKVPDSVEDYESRVLHQAKVLIDNNLWPIPMVKVSAWLGNFKNIEHRYLATHILDSMMFRTKEMLQSAYSRFLNTEFRKIVISETSIEVPSLHKWGQYLRSRKQEFLSNIIFAPVKSSKGPGQSGEIVIHQLTSKLMEGKISKSINANTWETAKNKIIIVVDDFLGSGTQFNDFAAEINLIKGINENKIIYAPFMAMEDGIKLIKSHYPELNIIPLEVIKNNTGIFSGDEKAQFRNDKNNTIADARMCYEDICSTHSINEKYRYGWDNQGLSLGFEWGCPNQALGILWYEPKGNGAENHWENLISRRM